jgi:hypothetical protein
MIHVRIDVLRGTQTTRAVPRSQCEDTLEGVAISDEASSLELDAQFLDESSQCNEQLGHGVNVISVSITEPGRTLDSHVVVNTKTSIYRLLCIRT